jgi:hypothetical protein
LAEFEASDVARARRSLLFMKDVPRSTHPSADERTLRYESHAERSLERAVAELDRLQSERRARELLRQEASSGTLEEKEVSKP